jgi:hypothetical protein
MVLHHSKFLVRSSAVPVRDAVPPSDLWPTTRPRPTATLMGPCGSRCEWPTATLMGPCGSRCEWPSARRAAEFSRGPRAHGITRPFKYPLASRQGRMKVTTQKKSPENSLPHEASRSWSAIDHPFPSHKPRVRPAANHQTYSVGRGPTARIGGPPGPGGDAYVGWGPRLGRITQVGS